VPDDYTLLLAELARRDTMIGDLRDFVLAQFEEKQKALDAALTAQKEAVTKAEIATDRIALRAQSDQEALRGEMSERLAALRGVLELATESQKEAVLKQERTNELRFDGVNEWREQSADRERSQAQERATLSASFILREVAEAQFDGIRKEVGVLRDSSSHGAGVRAGISQLEAKAIQWISGAAAVITAIYYLH
jgi:hypothetical protein